MPLGGTLTQERGADPCAPGSDPASRAPARRHRHPVALVHFCVLCWSCGSLSLRAVAFVVHGLRAVVGWVVPSHETVRSWTLRLGLFLLRRPLQRAGGWVFVLDHTISLGNAKALLVVGVRLGARRAGRASRRAGRTWPSST